MSIDFSELSFIQWFLILFFSLLGLGCLFVLAWQFRPSESPVDNKRQLLRSIISGLMTGGFTVLLLLIWGVFLWVETGHLKSMAFVLLPMLCLIPLIVTIMIGISFLQFWYITKMRRHISEIGIAESKRNKTK